MSIVSGNKIEAPVSISDVQIALGDSSSDLGRLCTSDKINMWARYKPQRNDGPLPMLYSQRVGGSFGLQVPFCTLDVMNEKVYELITNPDYDGGWEYLKPRGDRTAQGGDQEFYRLTDFVRIPTDVTDPFYNTVYCKGYNPDAKIPFYSYIVSAGAELKWDSTLGVAYYEINTTVAGEYFTFSFHNSIGDDLHLQDFIDLNTVYEDGKHWRPVLQVFDNDVILNSENLNARLPWYQRGQPDFEFAGDAITEDTTGSWTVSLPLSDFSSNPNKLYHLCIGVGCCTQSSPLVWKDNNKSLFIIPYSKEQLEDGDTPFYCCFKVVSYSSRTLRFTDLQYHVQAPMPGWEPSIDPAPYFKITSMSDTAIGLTMTISKLEGQALNFIKETPNPDSNSLIITAEESITGKQGTNYINLEPSSGSSSNWASVSSISIPTGPETETVTLYAKLNIGNIPVGQTGQYHVKAKIGNGDFNDISYFSISKIQYT